MGRKVCIPQVLGDISLHCIRSSSRHKRMSYIGDLVFKGDLVA